MAKLILRELSVDDFLKSYEMAYEKLSRGLDSGNEYQQHRSELTRRLESTLDVPDLAVK